MTKRQLSLTSQTLQGFNKPLKSNQTNNKDRAASAMIVS